MLLEIVSVSCNDNNKFTVIWKTPDLCPVDLLKLLVNAMCERDAVISDGKCVL